MMQTKRDKLVYVSGKYSGTLEETKENVQKAREVAREVWNAGYTCICPHLNSAFMDFDTNVGYEGFLAGCLRMIDNCDALIMIPGWVASRGANIERLYANEREIPIFEYISEMDKWFNLERWI